MPVEERVVTVTGLPLTSLVEALPTGLVFTLTVFLHVVSGS